MDISTPGSSAITSFMELVCIWSIACLEILDAVLLPALFWVAVTTTCSRRNDTGLIFRFRSTVSPSIAVNVVSTFSIPKNSTERVISPEGTFSMLNRPSLSVIEYILEGDSRMLAKSTGLPSSSDMMPPLTVILLFCAGSTV